MVILCLNIVVQCLFCLPYFMCHMRHFSSGPIDMAAESESENRKSYKKHSCIHLRLRMNCVRNRDGCLFPGGIKYRMQPFAPLQHMIWTCSGWLCAVFCPIFKGKCEHKKKKNKPLMNLMDILVCCSKHIARARNRPTQPTICLSAMFKICQSVDGHFTHRFNNILSLGVHWIYIP